MEEREDPWEVVFVIETEDQGRNNVVNSRHMSRAKTGLQWVKTGAPPSPLLLISVLAFSSDPGVIEHFTPVVLTLGPSKSLYFLTWLTICLQHCQSVTSSKLDFHRQRRTSLEPPDCIEESSSGSFKILWKMGDYVASLRL